MSLNPLPKTILGYGPPTALAPMQDVTTLPFMKVIDEYGSPDYYFTEYFRVHPSSRLKPHILSSITQNPTRRPIFAQIIGEDIPQLQKTVKELQQYPIAGIDLNMGCPAPKIYKKNVGGGLLRDPNKIEGLFCALRESCKGSLSIKMRIGFEDDRYFENIIDSLNTYKIDFVSIHGRTVKQMYRGGVDYQRIALAVKLLDAPVFANGNLTSFRVADQVYRQTQCHGLMVGRSAIRNPWIFRQIREFYAGEAPYQPTLSDVYNYIFRLWEIVPASSIKEKYAIGLMKKFLAFIGQSVDPEGKFLYRARRTRTFADLQGCCQRYLLDGGKAESPYPLEPYPAVVARPNHEI